MLSLGFCHFLVKKGYAIIKKTSHQYKTYKNIFMAQLISDKKLKNGSFRRENI